MQGRARRFIASTSSSTRVANDLLTAVESPEPAETMEGGGGATAHEPVASTEAAAPGSRPYTFNAQAIRQYCDDYSENNVTAAAIGPKWPAAAVLSLWVLVTPVLYGPSTLGSSTTDSGFEFGTDICSGAPAVLPPFCLAVSPHTQKPPSVTSHHSMSHTSAPSRVGTGKRTVWCPR